MRLDEIEEALHDSFDHDHLAIYADELQRRGDPRGELIALDLRADERIEVTETGELSGAPAIRRRELARELLGPVAAAHPLVRCRYGFVDLMFAPRPELYEGSMQAFTAALSGPLGRYVRDVTLYGDGQRLLELMGTLGRQPRPFLTRLAVEGPHYLHYIDLPAELVGRAVEVMPRLQVLEGRGRRAVPAIEFPTVRQVVSHCYDAVLGLCGLAKGAPCFPRVEHVNFKVAWSVQQDRLEALLPPRELPMLRELDMSRCTEPIGAGTGEDVFRYLRRSAIAPQIEWLRVPSVDHLEQAIHLQAAIDRMPALQEIGIAGGYPMRAEPLRHPTAMIRPIA